MKASHLAMALLDLMKGRTKIEQKRIVEQFLHYVRERGYSKLLPTLARELKMVDADDHERAVLTVAHEENARIIATSLEAAKNAKVVVDEKIIGGYTLEGNNTFIDASYRGALIRIYQSLTK